MTFNWFNRKLNEQPETDKAAEPSEPTSETSESAAQPSQEEYLNFAKLAYENLKKKQAAQAEAQEESSQEQPAATESTEADSGVSAAATEVEPDITEPDIAEPDIAGSPVTEPGVAETAVADANVAEAAEPEIAEPGVAEPEIAEPEVAEPAAAEAGTQATPVPEAPTEATPVLAADASSATSEADGATAQPLWLRAEADREARLERLRETAIEEPEPIVAQTPAAKSSTPQPIYEPIDLDDGFIWSAEVLAAQGRRIEDITIEEITWLKRLRQGLDKTRRGLINQLKAIVGQGPLNEDAVLEIESLLLQADVGVAATDAIIAGLQSKLREEALPPDQAIAYLKQLLRDMLEQPVREGGFKRGFGPEKDKLNIWLMTGVNGAGKTTTIGKLAHVASKSGYQCLIAAADTFRAAAVEQVKVWGQRSDVEVIANPGQNTDPAAVVFDAITSAQSRGTELLLVDTAGRLQNKKNLMDELAKVRRIIDKKAEGANVEALLVLDSTLGQNGLQQAKVFAEAAQLSGVVLTKLDGTAKGGIALAVVQQLGLPIRFIGAGEGIEDLRPFSSYEFVEALISG
ncbi:signal recognition particle-docking protein FtsY [Alkalinema sp. FACHB-956]|uniref:signal recognition particle-docking protein FtsY n=1 Tax=Alkalinema sp. FACHB-956 TaxID=2692768 RepID=UPI0016833192|nr:signal recognition particle-docking protein FtsY [Alkalinema sp. FACHB-956]MBD2327035.1 signal recognition particle-docking protein FtsY [Alkalinema sp. FACHB-956]